MIDNETGYIKLNKFAGSTPHEIATALNDLNSKGMKTLILDLQNNGGGLLQAAVALCDEFLESKRLVVYTQGEHYPKQSFETSENGLFRKGKLIVLINESSASASEIVSGAIQDWDRGLIIGRRSFGKGLVQRPFALMDNSQLRLTTAEYFTPSGRFIQKPFNKGLKEYRAEIIQRAQSGQLTKKDTLVPPDSLMKFTNNKRKVYGGGGITPDIYVPIDTSLNSEYYLNFLRKGLVNQYTTEFNDKNKKSILEKNPKMEDFYTNFNLDSAQFNQFLVMGDSAKIKRDTQAIEKSGSMIKTLLKANIGRGIYGAAAFYKIIMDIDPVIQKAIAIRRENFSKYKVRNE
jgi:carboxyl-terminal processing protease